MKGDLKKWLLLWWLWLPIFVTGQSLSGEIVSISNPGCSPPFIGAISVIGLDGSPPYTYTLDASIIQPDGDFSNLVLGDHEIIINDINDASFIIDFTIVIDNQLVISVFDLAHVECFGNTDGFISVVASSGTSPFQYSIDGGLNYQANGDFSNLGSGIYQIIAIDGSGCMDTISAEVLALSQINILSINQENINCYGAANGSVQLLGELGTSPYYFSIDGINFQENGLFDSLSAGQYQFWLEDLNGCKDSIVLNFTQPPVFELNNISVLDVNCFNGTNGEITFDVSGGDTPYTFQLNDTNDVNIPFFGSLGAGDYHITAIDDNACEIDSVVTVEEPDSLYFSVQNVQLPSCAGGNNGGLQLVGIGGVGPYTYRKGTTPWQSSGIYTGLSSGSYVFKVRDANNCVFTLNYTLESQNDLILSLLDQQDVYCDISSNGLIEVVASGGVAPYSYSINGGPFQSSGIFTSLFSGNYSVTVQDANSCTTDISVDIVETNDLSIDNLLIVNAICGSTTSGEITVNASGGLPPYLYTLDGGIPQLSNIFTSVSLGPHNVTLISDFGCSVTTSAFILEESAVGANVVDLVNPLCDQSNDGIVELEGNNGSSPYLYSIDLGLNWQLSGSFTGLSDSSYIFLVQDLNGCIFDTIITLEQQNQLYIELISGSSAICPEASSGSLLIEGQNGVSPYTYSSDGTNFSANSTFNGLSPGDHTFWIMDINGCIQDSIFSIGELEAPEVNVDSLLSPSCFGSSDGVISLSPSGTNLPYVYSFDGAPFQPVSYFTGLSAGSYAITVEDANMCQTDLNLNLVEATLFTASIDSVQDVLCKGEENGVIYFTLTGGQSPYKYRINNGAWQVASSSITSLFAGSYDVDFMDDNGCIITELITIDEPALVLDAEIMSITNVTCMSDTNGVLQGFSTGGSPPKLYSIDNINFQSSSTFTDLAVGNYTFYVIDGNGCTSSENFSIIATSPLSLAWATITPPSCEIVNNGFLSVGVISGSYPFTFQLNSNPPQNGGSFSNLGEGFYSILVNDANGCQATIQTLLNSVQTLAIEIDSVQNIICVDDASGEIWLSASGGDPAYSFYLDGVLIPGGYAGGLDNGIYNSWVVDEDGCSDSIEVAVLQESLLQGSIYAQQNILCNNGMLGSVTVNGTTGTSPYLYSINGIDFSSNNVFNDLEEGIYTVTIQDATNCETEVEVDILLLTELNLQISEIIDPSCFGSNDAQVSFIISNGIGPYEYSLDASGLLPSNVFTGLLSGNHSIYAEDSQGCSDSLEFIIDDPLPIEIIVDSIGLASCFGMSDAYISVSALNTVGAVEFTLSPSFVSNSSGLFTGLGDGSYTISVSDENLCFKDTTFTITSPSSLNITINEVSPLDCYGETNAIVEVIVNGGLAPYEYFIDSLSNANNQFLNNLGPGVHEVLVSDSNDCQAQIDFMIEEPDSIYIQYSLANAVTCFGLDNGTAFFLANGGSGDLSMELNTSQIPVNGYFTGLSPSLYTLFVSDSLGCTIDYEFEISEPPLLVIDTLIIQNPTCYGDTNGSIEILVGGGTPDYNYFIPSIGSGLDSLVSNIGSGAYYVSVTDQNGCNVSQVVSVLQPDLFVLDVLAVVPPNCFGDSAGTVLVEASGGNGSPSYGLSWNDLGSASVFHNLPPGMVHFFAMDSLGCIDSTFTFVPNAQELNLGGQIEDATCYGFADGFIEFSPSGGAPNYQFSMDQINWSATTVFNGLIANDYTFYIKDSNGCIKDSILSVNQPDSLMLSAVTVYPVTCSDPASGVINFEIQGGTTPYESNLNGNILNGSSITFDGLTIGSYQIITSDSNGCLAYLDTSLLQVENMSAYIEPVVLNCYGDQNGVATVVFNGGSGQFLFQWDNSTNDVTMTTQPNLEAGITYTVTVVDSLDENCFATAEVTPTQPEEIQFELYPFSPSCDPEDLWMSVEVISGGVSPLQFVLNDEDPVNTSVFSDLNEVSSRFKVIDADGCSVYQWAIPENPNVIEAFFEVSDDVVSMAEGEVLFTDLSGNSAYLEWDFGDGIIVNGNAGSQAVADFTTGPIIQPEHIYNQFGVYQATLSVSSDFGCEDDYQKSITVLEDHRVFIPNSFSPDGDGINDIFRVEGATIADEGFSMSIYDRSGVVIFQSFDRMTGWDGRGKNGNEMQPVVYVYMVSYYSGGRLFEKNGTVTLLR